MSDRHTLIRLLRNCSTRRGEFTLASGKQSMLYIDARLTTMRPDGLALIGSLGLAALKQSGWQVDAIGGLTLGADPISCAISYASAFSDRPLSAFTVRKEAKTHGAQRLVEGPLKAGNHVVIIEDVITTGGSALRAVEAVRDIQALVSGVLALVDREEGGKQAIEKAGLPVISLVRASEIMDLTL